MEDSLIVRYSQVKKQNISWLWKPYIAFGKITLVQGDPGEGKSTMMLNIAAAVSSRSVLPDGSRCSEALNVIYQCSEDGIADTIKPRLVKAKADCNHIAFINEEDTNLTLGSQQLEKAIADFNARLVIIDPLQAYLGNADISYIGGMRQILHRLNLCAAFHNCAVVLVGHLNKNESSKTLYRGLGTIDVIATARSVLQVEHLKENSEIKLVKQLKNNITSLGKNCFFRITRNGNLKWVNSYDGMVEDSDPIQQKDSKKDLAVFLLRKILSEGPVEANTIYSSCSALKTSNRTLYTAKKMLGIRSFRKDGLWFWDLPKNKEDYFNAE